MISIVTKKILELIYVYKLYAVLFLIISAAFGATAVWVVFMPGGIFEHSESPEFCASCHLHEKHYDTWRKTGAHSTKKCVDCHLPNDNIIEHFAWKSIDGLHDVALFFTGNFSDDPKASARAKNVIQSNCIRCHSEIVSKIDSKNRNCWDCHRIFNHKTAGIIK